VDSCCFTRKKIIPTLIHISQQPWVSIQLIIPPGIHEKYRRGRIVKYNFADMNLVILTRFLNGFWMIAMPIFLGIFLVSKYKLSWKIWSIGGASFIISQIFHFPFNYFLLNPQVGSLQQNTPRVAGSLLATLMVLRPYWATGLQSIFSLSSSYGSLKQGQENKQISMTPSTHQFSHQSQLKKPQIIWRKRAINRVEYQFI
jgi:hypothetical protein